MIFKNKVTTTPEKRYSIFDFNKVSNKYSGTVIHLSISDFNPE